MNEVVIELKNISKFFPAVIALDSMNLQLKAGSIHGLIGENGAGKSTLIKVLTGVHRPDEGEIYVKGQRVSFEGPMGAKEHGIACVYQELNIVKELSITDNMFIGNYVKNKFGLLNYKYMHGKAHDILNSMNQDIGTNVICGNIGMGQQQMVEIGKAIMFDAKVLILDEPTSSLGEKETAELFKTLRILKEKGLAILFVSHKLNELYEICDEVTVMRDGKHVITAMATDLSNDELISHMVGRKLENLYPKQTVPIGEVAIEVKNLTRYGEYYDISFLARKGEILGFSGLVGAGRTELMRGIFAADNPDRGEIFINGKKKTIRTPKHAVDSAIAFLTEDRKTQGLILIESIENNMTLANIDSFKRYFLIDKTKIRKQAVGCIDKLQLHTPSSKKIVGELSGGNQQKVVIGKWIVTNAEVFIFDEPTRGIDVGAKVEVYRVMQNLVAIGKCVLMVSSELPEILGMCDRVIVMRNGRKMTEILRDSKHFNQESIMKAAWGGDINEVSEN